MQTGLTDALVDVLQEFGFDLVEKDGWITAERRDRSGPILVDVLVGPRMVSVYLQRRNWNRAAPLTGPDELRRLLQEHAPRQPQLVRGEGGR